MDDEKMKEYMLRGIDGETVFKECIKHEVLILAFSAFVIVFSMSNIIFIILGILPNIVYLATVLSLHEEGAIIGVPNILHNGIWFLCMSFLSAMLSLEMVFRFSEKGESAFVIGMMIVGYVAVVLLFRYIFRKSSEKKADAGEKEKIKVGPAIGTILGTIVAIVFLKNMDQISAIKVGCFLCILMSYIFSIGIFGISQYRYLMKHKELLEGQDGDK